MALMLRSDLQERLQWLFTKCENIVNGLRDHKWLEKVESDPGHIEWDNILQKLELDFLADAYKRELSNIVLLR